MKDSEFIELLNLYLDHEISAADAARIEHEVQHNPARRQTYLEYCRLQKACALLAQDFASQTDEQKIIAFEPRRSSWAPGLSLGGLAVAAACVALVFVNRTREIAPVAAPALVTTVVLPALPVATTAETVSRAVAQTVAVPERRADLQLVSASNAFALPSDAGTDALLATMASQQAVALDWINRVKLAPMQQVPVEALRFDARSAPQDPRIYRSVRQPMATEVEMAAFRFQR
ncbi:MAG: zf-HC2 domain-containing protein [Opitutus sp.]|nr:zf-HC2 domain-containing protein [Opitutus sp.]